MFDMRKMRSGAKVVLWIVLTAFLLTIFILWGAQMSFNKSNPDTVARIGKTDILYADVSKLWQEKVQQLLDKGQKVSDAREKELKKGIASFDKQIALHRDKIANPSKHIKKWHELDPRQQEALINKKWQSDIDRLTEQRDILHDVLKSKLSE